VCDKCDAIDRRLSAFQRLRETVDDELARTLIAMAVESLQSEKATLHPDENNSAEGYSNH
jgi:hypothetical protein